MKQPTDKQVAAMEQMLNQGREIGRKEGRRLERARIRRAIRQLQIRYENHDLQRYVLDQALIVIAPKRKGGTKK